MERRSGGPGRVVASAAGGLLGAVSGSAARLRRGKPLHPRGTVLAGRLVRHGSARPWGAAWLDEPGEDAAVVRLSRAVGLPSGLPDVLGLALRVPGAPVDERGDGDGEDGGDGGAVVDLLFATTGLGRLSRWALVPHRDVAVPYGALLPLRAPRGLVLLAVAPAGEAVGAGRLSWRLLAAAPLGEWEHVGDLDVDLAGLTREDLRDGLRGDDAPVDFEPVLHTPPGLTVPPVLAALRHPAYASARRGRRADPAGVEARPSAVLPIVGRPAGA